MKDIIGFFSGPNLLALAFIAICCAGLGAISMNQKSKSSVGRDPHAR